MLDERVLPEVIPLPIERGRAPKSSLSLIMMYREFAFVLFVLTAGVNCAALRVSINRNELVVRIKYDLNWIKLIQMSFKFLSSCNEAIRSSVQLRQRYLRLDSIT